MYFAGFKSMSWQIARYNMESSTSQFLNQPRVAIMILVYIMDKSYNSFRLPIRFPFPHRPLPPNFQSSIQLFSHYLFNKNLNFVKLIIHYKTNRGGHNDLSIP